jgi:DNA-binding NarL/FixJ family response regulator
MTDNRQPTDGLSQREREVLVLIASGNSSRQIAEHLGTKFKTVVVHRHNLHTKLKLHNVADLTRAATRMGLIDP